MPPAPSPASRDEPVIRDGGDACPGALRLHAADDGYLARVRLPGGLLTARQADLLGQAAGRFGDGNLDVTSRGNVQLRGLADACGAELAALLDGAGLLPAPGHERVRNIVATPMSGLDGPPERDVLPWVREFDRMLCADARVTALSGRFLFAFDDGRGDVAALDPDVTVLALGGSAPGGGLLGSGRALVRLGGGADAVEVDAGDAPRAALLAAHAFLDAVDVAGTRAWRVAELPAGHALSAGEFAGRLSRAGIGARYRGDVKWPCAEPVRPRGVGPGPRSHLCVLPPLGRFTAGQWRELVRVAGQSRGPLRITPWRGVVLADVPVDGAGLLEAAGLVVAADSVWESVTACTGRPGCAKSLADVRADAQLAVRADRPAAPGAMPVHFSGCERRCGHPRGTAWADLVAAPDGYRLTAPGRPARTGLAPSDLAAALAEARTTPHPSSQTAVKK
ncbi:cobalamin biosynthesis protein CobG [Streptomyces sp. NPDC101132]|uniref:cobalamin biosynthesis protein CobG n=1 Tax=Streptomyces sp. NPDC101132 TaxID=3366110 RepID=UPI00380D76FC